MAAICPRWGCLKKRGGWKWEGSLKKPDVIRSPRNKDQKKKGSPSAVGVFGRTGTWRIVKKEKGKGRFSAHVSSISRPL